MRRLAFLLCLATGCASTQAARPEATPAPATPPAPTAPAPEAKAPPAEPLDVEAARARELAPLARQRLAPPSGLFTGEVEGSEAATYESGEGFSSFNIALGEASGLMCFVYDHPIDTGGALLTIVQALTQDANLSIQRVYPTDVVESGGVPAVFLDVDYTAAAEGGQAAGQVKLMVRASSELPVLCAHDELGYARSFRRITLAMANSLSTPGQAAPAAPRYAEIQVVRLGKHPVGFEWWEVRDTEEGKRATESTSLLMFPRSATELLMDDTSFLATGDAKGQVEQLNYAKARGGELTVRMAVKRQAAGTYHYEGMHGGKEVEGTFQSKRGLSHELSTARAVREQLLPGKVKELTFDFYRPSADPTKPSEVVYRKAEAGPRAVTVSAGSSTFTGTTDERGLIEKVTMPLPGAPVEMSIERVFSRGEP